MKKDREKKQKYSNITDATTMGSTAEESAFYASANREHFSVLDRLEEISKRKINPNYIKQNINQQAGYSAEIKEQAHVNEHNILAGKMGRLRQYDDLSSEKKPQVKKFFPNHATPSKNHEIVDYISVDEKGNVIPGTAVQSKFVGRNGEECFKKLLSKDYEKYWENGAKMKIARNRYGDFQRAVNTRIKSLESQIAKQKGLGDFQKAAHLEEKLQKCKTIKAHTRPASTTKREAIEARLNPKLSTAKDVTSVSHQAGMNAAQTGAWIGGCVSLVTNVYECIANGKDPKKAIKHTAIATLKGGALSYVSAFASSSLGGLMQSSANKIIQSLGKGSVPAMIVGACVANATILGRYFSGKIDKNRASYCGLCCKNITGIIELIGFDVSNGVCKFLDLETNLCKIYESRPLICRIDEARKKLYPHIPLKEFYAKNAEVCNALQEANHMNKSFRVILKK
ncbi:hypothetical protein HPNQ4099_1021 [Helicobacter pylori NQ4099]|uniref:Uncharacterized protein n=1 Tax=Helicobacter pylori NQ4099 TaxID=992026 RepID=I9Q855_HELPX|nr:YkgJ family cysteine cluster protein [Helicobacter pylori]EJB29389.1 hypothetical protein HPNQ4099_1021 [Helicobacter pylori NQ4099]